MFILHTLLQWIVGNYFQKEACSIVTCSHFALHMQRLTGRHPSLPWPVVVGLEFSLQAVIPVVLNLNVSVPFVN